MTELAQRNIGIMEVLLPANLVVLYLAIREAERVLGDNVSRKCCESIGDSEDCACPLEIDHAIDEDGYFVLHQGLLIEDGSAGEAGRCQ